MAQELFQGSDLDAAEEAERPGEKTGQHSPLREEHVTCVQSKEPERPQSLPLNSLLDEGLEVLP